jgi:hypothetical protein
MQCILEGAMQEFLNAVPKYANRSTAKQAWAQTWWSRTFCRVINPSAFTMLTWWLPRVVGFQEYRWWWGYLSTALRREDAKTTKKYFNENCTARITCCTIYVECTTCIYNNFRNTRRHAYVVLIFPWWKRRFPIKHIRLSNIVTAAVDRTTQSRAEQASDDASSERCDSSSSQYHKHDSARHISECHGWNEHQNAQYNESSARGRRKKTRRMHNRKRTSPLSFFRFIVSKIYTTEIMWVNMKKKQFIYQKCGSC